MSGKTPRTNHQAVAGPILAWQDFGELLAMLGANHASKLRLCEELEAIADSLPDNVNPGSCMAAARRIVPVVTQAHEFEDGVLWPVLRRLRPADARLEEMLTRLRNEHVEDEGYAEELALVLTDRAMCVGDCSAEAMGYMLRGFFEALRRHIAFERAFIVPVLEEAREGQAGESKVKVTKTRAREGEI